MDKNKTSNITKGTIGTYLAAAELARRGFIVSALSQTAKGIDILAANPGTLAPVAIQVKTTTKKRAEWMLNHKAEDYTAPGLFYCLVKLADDGRAEFFVVPSRVVATSVRASHRKWMKAGGRDSPIRLFRDPDGKWLDRWDVLDGASVK